MRLYKFSTWHMGVFYECHTTGFYLAYLDLAGQIAKTLSVPLELEIEGEYSTKVLKLTAQIN